MKSLNRIKVDKFSLEEALTFEELEKNKNNIEKYLIKMENVFTSFSRIDLQQERKVHLLNGVKLSGFKNLENGVYNIYVKNEYIGLGIVQNGTLKRDIII